MRKLLVIFGILIGVVLTSVAVYANIEKNYKPSDYKIGIRYEDAITQDKPILVLFYMDWCGYCAKFMPKFRVVDSLYHDKFNVVMINADDPTYKDLANDVGLSGFPSLYIIDPKYDNRVFLSNGIYFDLKKLRVELDRFLRIRALLDK